MAKFHFASSFMFCGLFNFLPNKDNEILIIYQFDNFTSFPFGVFFLLFIRVLTKGIDMKNNEFYDLVIVI